MSLLQAGKLWNKGLQSSALDQTRLVTATTKV